MWLLNS